jgi:MoaA/NifB/PqqE/SkfB family radical SAM enzyme
MSLSYSVKRRLFEAALSNVDKKVRKDRHSAYVGVVDAMQKYGGVWGDDSYARLRKAFGEGGKWAQFFDRLLDTADAKYIHDLFMAFGFNSFMSYTATQKNKEQYGVSIPWVILFDPTTACNLHCTGCWAAEYGHTMSLSYTDMEKIVVQGEELGIREYIMTGGEPTMRKKDIVKLAKAHKNCGFGIFTNATMIDQEFCNEIKSCGNILLNISIEGDEETTDARRGKGTYQRIMKAMDLLKSNGIVYGTSICYTSRNYKAVTSDEFLDFLIDKGAVFSWYFHFMPVGMDAVPELMPTPEQREYLYHRIREVRAYEGGKQIFTMDFQNDGEIVGGCIAGGKYYCHINANGDVEPCVFIHYSSANIHDMTLLECLQQPVFKGYQAAQPFNDNLLRPCPMLENPEKLREIVAASGAKSTDMTAPESAEHLCSKCDGYAAEWRPVADKLWASNHPGWHAGDAADKASEQAEDA